MSAFVQQHLGSVMGMISGWDRVRFRGTLRMLANVVGMGRFLSYTRRLLKDFGQFALESSRLVRSASLEAAEVAGRPVVHLASSSTCKEQQAREIAKRDGIKEGLICVLTAVEPCGSYDIRSDKEAGKLRLVHALRKCQHLYHYYLHPVFGFMHVRLQTWLPFNQFICINGREWLSRQMDAAGIGYVRRDNCFTRISDVEGAQRLLEEQVRFDYGQALGELAAAVNGGFLISGFRNRDVQTALFGRVSQDPARRRRESGQVTRMLRMLRGHGLIQKVSHTHRYLVSDKGRQVIAALIAARKADVNKLLRAA